MIYKIHGLNYEVYFEINQHAAFIKSGFFGEINILKVPLFDMIIKDCKSGESIKINSESNWEKVNIKKNVTSTDFIFSNPEKITDITVFVTAKSNENGIIWTQEVVNNNLDMSVMSITYPTPRMSNDYFNYFIPVNSGQVIVDAGRKKIFEKDNIYPSWHISMQYFAVYGKESGIYIGIEDGRAATKRFSMTSGEGECSLVAEFFGIGASNPANSFKVYGKSNWQFFSGDWFDASMIYSEFVKKDADWLPEISENGREDTSQKFKDVAFWLSDYIPNSELQGDNKPMNLSAGSDIYEKDYWYKAPIELQKLLNVPIAYHVYNWHKIPFNIEYPHFLPAKEEFTEHIKELQENNIYVLPYINAVCWEMYDTEMNHEVNFENTGSKEAIVCEDGNYEIEEYPQKTVSGKISNLVPRCGKAPIWHKMMEELSRDIEKLGVDGIYYDQVSATSGMPCYNKNHLHLPGGGNQWVEGYNSMMRKINSEKPEGGFYFSECNAEPFMKSFDGYLTWMWVQAYEVPAFSAVYAGYIQLIGRCTIGNKKDDFGFFKYCTAKSFVSGQQLGWCKADLIYSFEHIEFLKAIVGVRYKYAKLFNSAKMLRPPMVKTNLPKYVTKAGLWFEDDIVSEYIISGAWKYRNNTKVVIFAINIFENVAEFSLEFDLKEYGIADSNVPEDFVIENGKCKVTGKLERYEVKAWEIILE